MTVNLNLLKAAETQARETLEAAAQALDEIGITVWASPAHALLLYHFDRRHGNKILEFEDATILAAQQERINNNA